MEGTEATGLTLGALPSNEVQRYGLLKGHTLGGFKVVCCQNVFTPRSLKPHEYGVRVRARAPCARARTIVRSHHSMLIEALLALSEVP